jgi:hypothetical protein
VPFHPAHRVPEDHAAFTTWYRRHVKQFFGFTGAEYDALFGLHALEHKPCGDPPRLSYDGLCLDGSANYLKLLREEGGWKVVEFKARSFKHEAKAALAPWIVQTYSKDHYPGPPPITESPRLLTYKDANRFARKALAALQAPLTQEERDSDPVVIYYPLGLELRQVQAYKAIKLSAFLFRTPQQHEKFDKAVKKFEKSCGCGLEVLSRRRGCEGRSQGSLNNMAALVYQLIRSREENPTKALNLTRRFRELDAIRRTHLQEILRRKAHATEELIQALDARRMPDAVTLTGLFLVHRDLICLD